jgi:hypothetical protein
MHLQGGGCEGEAEVCVQCCRRAHEHLHRTSWGAPHVSTPPPPGYASAIRFNRLQPDPMEALYVDILAPPPAVMSFDPFLLQPAIIQMEGHPFSPC